MSADQFHPNKKTVYQQLFSDKCMFFILKHLDFSKKFKPILAYWLCQTYEKYLQVRYKFGFSFKKIQKVPAVFLAS